MYPLIDKFEEIPLRSVQDSEIEIRIARSYLKRLYKKFDTCEKRSCKNESSKRLCKKIDQCLLTSLFRIDDRDKIRCDGKKIEPQWTG